MLLFTTVYRRRTHIQVTHVYGRNTIQSLLKTREKKIRKPHCYSLCCQRPPAYRSIEVPSTAHLGDVPEAIFHRLPLLLRHTLHLGLGLTFHDLRDICTCVELLVGSLESNSKEESDQDGAKSEGGIDRHGEDVARLITLRIQIRSPNLIQLLADGLLFGLAPSLNRVLT